MQSALKILFIDDHQGLRDGLGFSLSQSNPALTFFNASTEEEAVSILNNHTDIEIAIVDLNLNGENGVALIPKLRSIQQNIYILVYTMFNDPLHIENSLKANIQGYITKDSSLDELEQAIISISKGNTYFNKTASQIMYSLLHKQSDFINNSDNQTLFLFNNYKNLTKKEQEVFSLLAQKKETYEIAKLLHKSEKTVINQKSLIYQKLNIRDRLDLIDDAKLLGVIL